MSTPRAVLQRVLAPALAAVQAPARATLLALAVAALLGPGPAMAQEVARGVILSDSARVGDRVPVAVRVVVGPDERVALPEFLPLQGDELENAARVRERTETLEDGRTQVTGVYTITPWRPGLMELPEITVQVRSSTGEIRTITATLPALEVHSVLPADADALQPMPPKGVVGPSYAWWPFVLLALLLAAVAFLAWWVMKRRRGAGVGVALAVPAVPPRERALAALHEARDAGLVERGEWKDFYSRISHALREYLEALEPTWGEDLTTTEVLARVRTDVGPREAAALSNLLRAADQVKFARRTPDGEAARAEWTAARDWVARFDGPPRPETVEAAA
jgi:hypothetical protein